MSTKPFLGPLTLVILDGWGESPHTEGNAIKMAKTPVMTELTVRYPHTLLIASGIKVGLPDEQRGNSEAGHMNLGAGRIIEQDVVDIEVCRRSEGWIPRHYFLGDEVPSTSIDLTLAVADIYARVKNEDMQDYLDKLAAEAQESGE